MPGKSVELGRKNFGGFSQISRAQARLIFEANTGQEMKISGRSQAKANQEEESDEAAEKVSEYDTLRLYFQTEIGMSQLTFNRLYGKPDSFDFAKARMTEAALMEMIEAK